MAPYDTTTLVQYPAIIDGVLWYPGTDVQMQAYQSVGDGFTDASNCTNNTQIRGGVSTMTALLAPIETFPLSRLGFKTPFRLR